MGITSAFTLCAEIFSIYSEQQFYMVLPLVLLVMRGGREESEMARDG